MSVGSDTGGISGRVPATLVILSAILLAAVLATLVVPRGEYQRVLRQFPKLVAHTIQEGEDLAAIARAVGASPELRREQVLDRRTHEPVTALAPGARVLVQTPGLERTAIVPGTYERVALESEESLPRRVLDAGGGLFLAPIRGFIERAEVIAFVFLIGGAFGVVLATGAIDRALNRAVARLGEGWLRILVIPVSMVLFSLGGAIFGLGESTIGFVLVTIPLAIRLGYDTVTGICLCYFASQIGFAGAFFTPFTVGIAQSIAELPHLSGLGFRLVTWVLVTVVGVAFVSLWAKRVRANPALSPTRELDAKWRARLAAGEAGDEQRLGFGSMMVVIVALATVLLTGVGVALWGWYIQEMAALFVAAAIVAGFFGGYRPGRIAEEFTKGAKTMMEPALIIALSAGVLEILRDGRVLDTILQALAAPLESVVPAVGAALLMVVQAIINFFVPSGSGQAAMTMPVVTPLCDIISLDRQIGVLAFQFGDGFGNAMIPTSAVLMGVLGAARVSWVTWVKWVWPLIFLLHLVGAGLLTVAVYGPAEWMLWPAF